jgi:hypothetical protein
VCKTGLTTSTLFYEPGREHRRAARDIARRYNQKIQPEDTARGYSQKIDRLDGLPAQKSG